MNKDIKTTIRRFMRKGLITLGAFAIAASFLGIECKQPRPLRQKKTAQAVYDHKKDAVVAGNLYFYNHSGFMDRVSLMHVMDDVVNNFGNIGINFRNSRILNQGEFPALSGMDILVYVVDNNHLYPDSHSGYYGIDNLYQNYNYLKYFVGFPYGRLASNLNTSYICPQRRLNHLDLIADHGFPSGLFAKGKDEYTWTEVLKITSNLATHEVAHGLGASHTWLEDLVTGRVIYDAQYHLGNCGENSPKFYEENIFQMKDFIHAAGKISEPLAIQSLREALVAKRHYRFFKGLI